MIKFNVPPFTGKEMDYIRQAVENEKICGDGEFTRRCSEWIEQKTGCRKSLLTTSCTDALELSALLTGVGPGDEVIMPSYTFVSTANAFVLRGAVPVFVDVRPDTMNMDENLIEAAITERTRVIAPVHYAGVGCEMDKIMELAGKYQLMVVEDAAQGIMAEYKGKPLGAIGDFGCYSFHETKNYSCGEGGAILIQDEKYAEEAEIFREKGTDRSRFYRGQVDKYRWQNYGSSFLPSEMNAAYLWAQLEQAEKINQARLNIWEQYRRELEILDREGKLDRPFVPDYCTHNGHMFYIKTKDLQERTALIDFLKENGIMAVSHYVPLHSAPAGLKFGRFHGEDRYTTKESERLLRLPMYYGLKAEQVSCICDKVKEFYGY